MRLGPGVPPGCDSCWGPGGAPGLGYLAELVAQGVGLLGPLDVVVNSELMPADEGAFLEPLRRRVADLVGDLPAPRLVAARLGATAPALGAAGRALADWK